MKNKCRCREPKTHRDCAYCGMGYSDHICGVCKEAGIDGPVIRGTSRVICTKHRKVGPVTKSQVEKIYETMSAQAINL